MFVCETVNPSQVFNQSPCPLQQPVLLSLIQQLSADIGNNTELKHKYVHVLSTVICFLYYWLIIIILFINSIGFILPVDGRGDHELVYKQSIIFFMISMFHTSLRLKTCTHLMRNKYGE